MEQIKCSKCGKVIEGYSQGQCKYMLKQHQQSKKCKLKQKVIKNENKL